MKFSYKVGGESENVYDRILCVCVMLCVDVGTGYAVIPQHVHHRHILVEGDLSKTSGHS